MYLPVLRTISKDGFKAKWKILHLNRAYPQQWSGKKYKLDESDFGVKLFIPVDIYQKSTRTSKYALMFIVFAFIAFFFSEIINKVRKTNTLIITDNFPFKKDLMINILNLQNNKIDFEINK